MTLRIEHEVDSEDTCRFAAATDRAYMREVMRDYLLVAAGACSEILTCEVEFARRSDSRSLFQYAVTLRDRGSGEERRQIITGVTYGDTRTREIWEQTQELSQHLFNALAASTLYPLAYVPELDLMLQVFPFDHRLSALASFLEWPPALLESALLQQFGPESWEMTGWSADIVRYRVTLRACLQLTVAAFEAGARSEAERVFFAKIYASAAEAERAWNIQREVGEALHKSEAGVRLPTPIVYLSDQRTLVQEAIPGPSLFALQRGNDREAARQGAYHAARALATFHRLRLPAPLHRLRMPRVGAARVQRTAHRLRTAQPKLAGLVSLAEAEILSKTAALPDLPPMAVHGDFKPPHVILNDAGVVFLDFDKFAVGEPMLDVISMMRRLGPRGNLAGAFAREYFAHAPAEWEERLAPHYAAYLLENATGLERVVRSRQRAAQQDDDDRVASALEIAREALRSSEPLALLSTL